ncbi:MAG: MFS transporter [Phycisphaerales bacterium]|nr:MFS transporter [Phycisphaerales bacterium]
MSFQNLFSTLTKQKQFKSLILPYFRRYLFIQFILSGIAGMFMTTLLYQLFALTHTSSGVALLGLFLIIPSVIMGQLGGHYADKFDIKILFYYCSVALIIVLLLFFVTTFYAEKRPLSIFGHYLVYIYYFLISCFGVISGFLWPTLFVFFRSLLPSSFIKHASSMRTFVNLFGNLIGTILTGFFIAYLGPSFIFLISLLLMLLIIFILQLIPVHSSKATVPNLEIETKQAQSVLAGVKEGWAIFFKNKILLVSFFLDLIVVFFGDVVAVVPEFSNKVLHVGPVGYAWLNAASSIGLAATVTTCTFFPINKRQGVLLFICTFLFACCTFLFGWSSSFFMAFISLVGAGVFDGMSMIIRNQMIQIYSDKENIGRMTSIFALFINSSNFLGLLESGMAYKFFGLQHSIYFGSIVSLIAVISIAILSPKFRKVSY